VLQGASSTYRIMVGRSTTLTGLLFYHYYADGGASYLGINLLGWDSAGWPFVY
jgi:hypothetical protein